MEEGLEVDSFVSELNVSRKRKVWLIKVPRPLSDAWLASEPGADLGTLAAESDEKVGT
jgi:hypothetical protein